jgi:hypothetical protein
VKVQQNRKAKRTLVTRFWSVLLVLLLILILQSTTSQAQDCSSGLLLIDQQSSFVGVPHTATLTLGSSFTLECWAQARTFIAGSSLIEQSSDTGSQPYYALGFDSAQRLIGRFTPYARTPAVTSPVIQNITSWHHYAFVFSTDSVVLYIDGQKVAGDKTGTFNMFPNSDSVRIGFSAHRTRQSFLGMIDEVRIWNVARTGDAIRASMSKNLTGTEAGLICYYSFDDGFDKTILHDFSKHNNLGYLVGPSASLIPTPPSAPIRDSSIGYKLASIEQRIDCPPLVCATSFDTSFRLYNRGGDQIDVSSIGFLHSLSNPFTIAGVTSFSLAPDSLVSRSVRIHFSPTTGGDYFDTLIATTTTVCGGTVRIPVHAQYHTAEITSDINTLQFGTYVSCALPAQNNIRIRNIGTDPTTITNAIFFPSGDFEIVTPALPFVLGPGKDTAIVIRLLPGKDGPLSSTLSLTGVLAFKADSCLRNLSIIVNATRNSVALTIPPSLVLPTQQATLSSILIDTLLAIQNTGSVPVFLAPVSIQGKGFQILKPPPSIYLRPGDTLPVRVRFQSTSCGTFTSQLRIHITQPCTFDTTIEVRITILEPTLLSQALHYDFGSTCSPKDTIVNLKNTSSQTVILKSILFSTPGIFSLSTNVLPDSLPAGAIFPLAIHFAPAHAGDYNLTATVTMLPCGGVSFGLSGSAGIKNVLVSDTVLGFGRGCDFTAVTRSFKIYNRTASNVSIGRTDLVGSHNYQLPNLTLPVTISSGDSTQIDVVYRPLAPPTRDDALLFIRSSDSCFINAIELRGSREISSSYFLRSKADFDTVCPLSTKVLAVPLYNPGLDTVDIELPTLTATTPFTISDAPKQIAGHDTGYFLLKFAPTLATEYFDTLRARLGPCDKPVSIAIVGSGGSVAELALSDTLLDFGSINVGDTVKLCFSVTNLSCLPAIFDSSILALPTPFRYTDSTLAHFPFHLANGATEILCVTYAPQKIDTSAVSIEVALSTSKTTHFQLRGVGLASEIVLLDSILDYGTVVRNTSKPLAIRVQNRGNLSAQVNFALPNLPFALAPNTFILAPGATQNVTVTFTPTALTRYSDSTIATWETSGLQMVRLRGDGTEFGLMTNVLEVDFGDQHLNATASKDVKLTATNGFTINVTGISYQGSTGPTTFPATLNGSSIASVIDTILCTITFKPTQENDYRDTINFVNTSHPTSVIVTGRGVEAHPKVSPDTIDFGKVQLGGSATKQVAIADIGGWPLDVTQLRSASTLFVPENPLVRNPILPGQAKSYSIVFTPQIAKPVVSNLFVSTTGPDSLRPVVMIGRGSLSPASQPDVGLVVASTKASIGDRILIPISITNIPSGSITLDSFRITLAYSPYVVYLHNVVLGGTLGDGWQATLSRLSDSLLSVKLFGSSRNFTKGVLLYLDAEALLGPFDSTQISIVESNPDNQLSTLASLGTLIVTDCGNQSTNVSFGGVTSMAQTLPNPANESAYLEFNLKSAGHARIDLFDPLGRIARTFIDEDITSGEHKLTVSLAGLPSGRYVYVLKTNEATVRRELILTR